MHFSIVLFNIEQGNSIQHRPFRFNYRVTSLSMPFGAVNDASANRAGAGFGASPASARVVNRVGGEVIACLRYGLALNFQQSMELSKVTRSSSGHVNAIICLNVETCQLG